MDRNEGNVSQFGPFTPADLESAWKVRFGTWRVGDGRLRHVVPDGARGNVDIIIADTPDAESFNRLGTVSHAFPEAGWNQVTIRLCVALQQLDGFSVALDDLAVEWSPYYAMRPVLTDQASGSRGHEFADVPWNNIGEVKTIEIVGCRDEVQFYSDGRLLFSAPHDSNRGHRQITIDSFGPSEIHSVQIVGSGQRSCVNIPVDGSFKRAALVDFADDLCYAEFDAPMIDRLVDRVADLGIERIYWMNAIRVRPEAYGPDADSIISSHLDSWPIRINNQPGSPLSGAPSIRSCFPFLPKAVKQAHKKGLEIFGVIKLFDVGSATGYTHDSPFIDEWFCTSRPDAMMQRHQSGSANSAPVETIRIYKDDDHPHGIRPDEVTLWISDDNATYHRVSGVEVELSVQPHAFRDYWQGHLSPRQPVQIITLSKLNITSRYFAVVINGERRGSFVNRICHLAEAFSADGRPIETRRNLPELPRPTGIPWQGESGFVFNGYTTPRQQTGSWRGRDWIEMYQCLDGMDLGIAFTRDVPTYVSGVPDPAHPDARQFWWDWVIETLDAGVDGLDIRIMNHHNIIDWANHGFGQHTREAFKQRFGHELLPTIECRQKHCELLGDIYTDFLRRVSAEVRRRGKKMQHHVSRPMDISAGQRAMMNVNWDWRRWIKEGLLDAITLKDVDLSSDYCAEILNHARQHNVEALHCPYLCCLFDSSATWDQELSSLIERNRRVGMNGITLYEVASFIRGNERREVNLLYPRLTSVLNGAAMSKPVKPATAS